MFHDGIVQGVGLTVTAMIGMILAFKTRRSSTVDRMTTIAGILGVLVCLAWASKELVYHSSAVGWNRLPHVIGFVYAVMCGFGALCVTAVGICGMRSKQADEQSDARETSAQSVLKSESSPRPPLPQSICSEE